MLFVYNIGIAILRVIYGFASLFNRKAEALIRGKRVQKKIIEDTFPLPSTERTVWVHCASVGEFEQGRPIIEEIKKRNPSIKIVLTFFSPSGYELRKNYTYVDFVFYLPWDTSSNAANFVGKIKPVLAIFVKYEFWYNYASQLYQRKIPFISTSAIFRKDQIFFKPYGKLFRELLRKFDYLFVQNQESINLLQNHNITNTFKAGDSRIDRVYQIAEQKKDITGISKFKNSKKLFIAGSVWHEDLLVLNPFILANRELKFIIAPHEINENILLQIESQFGNRSVRYSNFSIDDKSDFQILILDCVGILSHLYQYSEYAYIGGGFRQGLHNILEPSCFGMPVFFGDRNYKKFAEAKELIKLGGAFEVASSEELSEVFKKLDKNPKEHSNACKITKQYIVDNVGATKKIMEFCENYIS